MEVTPIFARAKVAIAHNVKSLVTVSDNNIPFLDGLRAFSIMMVIGFHLLYPLTGYMSMEDFVSIVENNIPVALILQGHFGVDIFFVLSGFLIATIYFKDTEAGVSKQTSKFFVKRIFRLLPVYYVALTVAYVAFPSHCASIWQNLLYINNYFPSTDVCIFWSWSLAIEVQFYLLFPLFCVLLFKAKARNLFFGALFVGLCSVNLGYLFWAGGFDSNWDFANRFYFPTQFRCGSILLGVYAAYLQKYHSAFLKIVFSHPVWSPVLKVVALGLFAVPILVPSNSVLQNFDSYTTLTLLYEGFYRYIFSASIVVCILMILNDQAISLKQILSAKILYPISQLSYSLYIIHLLVIEEVYRHYFTALESLIYLIPLCLILLLMISAVMYILIERPAMQLRKRVLQRLDADVAEINVE